MNRSEALALAFCAIAGILLPGAVPATASDLTTKGAYGYYTPPGGDETDGHFLPSGTMPLMFSPCSEPKKTIAVLASGQKSLRNGDCAAGHGGEGNWQTVYNISIGAGGAVVLRLQDTDGNFGTGSVVLGVKAFDLNTLKPLKLQNRNPGILGNRPNGLDKHPD
jgi:hypothetical protein